MAAVRNNDKNKEKELEVKKQSAKTESEQIKNDGKCNAESESNKCTNRKDGKIKTVQRVLQKDGKSQQSVNKSGVHGNQILRNLQIAGSEKKMPGNKIHEKIEENVKKKSNIIKEKSADQGLLEEINTILNEELVYGPYNEAMKLHSLVCNRTTTGYAYDNDSFGNRYPGGDGDGLYENFHLPYNRDLLCGKSRRICLGEQPEVGALNYAQVFWWKVLLQDWDNNETTSKGSTKTKGGGRHKKKHNLYGKGKHDNVAKDSEKYVEEVVRHAGDHYTEKRNEPYKTSDQAIAPQKNIEESLIVGLNDCIEKDNFSKEEKDVMCDGVERSLKSPTTIADSTLCFRWQEIPVEVLAFWIVIQLFHFLTYMICSLLIWSLFYFTCCIQWSDCLWH